MDFSCGKTATKVLEHNSILNQYDVGRLFGSGGPEGVWKIYEGMNKTDGREVSIFVFDKNGRSFTTHNPLNKPKRKEAVTELLKCGLGFLQCYKHPRLLPILHGPDESADALAFVSEPLIGSLANIFSPNVSCEDHHRTPSTGGQASTLATNFPSLSGTMVKVDYTFIDVEYRLGLSQMTEALAFLHTNCKCIHRNICPNSIYVTKSGTWKLGGLEFLEKFGGDAHEEIPCTAWTTKAPKFAQPDLNFIAPEIQHKSLGSKSSDLYSLGMLMVALFNGGQSLIQANYSTNLYFKQAGVIKEQVKKIMPKIPIGLQEAVTLLVNPDTRQRPTTVVLSRIKYFSDPAVQALQYLDGIHSKDPKEKAQFFRTTLTDVFPFIPQKLWFQYMWPILEQEVRSQEALAAALEPVLFLVNECSPEEYSAIILPVLRPVFTNPKSIQASVVLLDRMAVILEKSSEEDMRQLILPLLFHSLESNMSQIQMAAISIVPLILDYFGDDIVRREILPKTRHVYEESGGDIKMVLAVLACVSKILDKLDRSAIIDEVLPLLLEVKLQDVNVLVRVLEIYQMMLADKRYGLSVNLIATKVLPLLIPQMVNPQIQYEHFVCVHSVLQEMFDVIDRHQRNKLKLDDVPKLPEWQRLRQQHAAADISVPNLVIRRPSLVQGPGGEFGSHPGSRKLSGASIAASQASSIGSSDSTDNNNYLRVSSAFGQRRLSDNVLNAPGHRRLSNTINQPMGVSCASSPGSAPNTPIAGFPIRRHSSAAFAQNRRYSSNALLSPSTGSQVSKKGVLQTNSTPFLEGGNYVKK